MKQETKDRWIAALRSGKYKQGYGQLYNTHQYTWCCLGVFLDTVHVPHDVDGYFMDRKQTLPTDIERCYKFDKTYVFLEREDTLQGVCTRMNDHYDYDFNMIADWLEENVKVDPT